MKKLSNKPLDFNLVLSKLKADVQRVPKNAANGDLAFNTEVFLIDRKSVV